jgi:methyltransferase (TIGR00027 family)
MTAYQGSVTARICAWARAYYSKSENHPSFNDYLAEKIIEDDRRLLLNLILKKRRQQQGVFKKQVIDLILPIPVSRSIFAEREFLEFKKINPNAQYLILGAGLDTFAWRSDSEKVSFFEVDHPFFQTIKKQRINTLKLGNRAVFVPVDFKTDSLEQKLLEAGFDKSRPTFVTIMGVSYYLNFETFLSTMRDILKLSDRLTVLFDFYEEKNISDADSRFEELRNLTSLLGEPMSDGYKANNVISALEGLGFEVEHKTPQEIKEKFIAGHIQNLKGYSNIHFIKASKN